MNEIGWKTRIYKNCFLSFLIEKCPMLNGLPIVFKLLLFYKCRLKEDGRSYKNDRKMLEAYNITFISLILKKYNMITFQKLMTI